MTDKQKKQRAPRPLSVEEISAQIGNLSLKDQIHVLNLVKEIIADHKQSLQEQMELINGAGK